ncbi:hypothetical protein UFOVP1169_18 [uncultured Caudovirales phage]|uniref:Uncharacterized protein n=1 Tax=uncultured Caudovirales phage TaxID=2100421 RepID=A0A6J5R585_9CAUD|nr:hypothetical protein UFOVP1169_18 [uncultured Caudovirales phage]
MDDPLKTLPIKRPGRPPGAVNLLTRTAKETIQGAAEGLGGMQRLVEWAQSDPVNERMFWGVIYPKLVPHQAPGEDSEGFSVSVVQFVKSKTIDHDPNG